MFRTVSSLVVLVAVFSACKSNNSGFSKSGDALQDELAGPSVPAMAVTRFSDVPLPEGAEEVMERSFVYESRSLQIGRMVYESNYSINQLAQFYIEEAPRYNWKLTSVLQAEGAQLAFEKPGKRMWVNVQDGRRFSRKSILIVNVVPHEESGRTMSEPLNP